MRCWIAAARIASSSAVIRKLEIIGEAAKGVPEDIRQSHLHVPWKEMAGMRDKLIHFYFGVDHQLVWGTIKKRLPEVKLWIKEILKQVDPEALLEQLTAEMAATRSKANHKKIAKRMRLSRYGYWVDFVNPRKVVDAVSSIMA